MKNVTLILLALFVSISLFSQVVVELPYQNDFEVEADFIDIWTIENVNEAGDGSNSGFWIYSPDYFGIDATGSIVYVSNSSNEGDDWLYTPGFDFEQGVNYELTFSYASLFDSYPANLEVYMGISPASEDMTMLIHDFSSYDNTSFTEYTISISVETSGTYNVGFHDYGPGGGYGGQTIDAFSLIEESTEVVMESLSIASIFPCPASDFLYVSDFECDSYCIYNVEGKLVQESKIFAVNNAVSVSNLENGFYLIEIEDKNSKKQLFKFSVFK